MSINPTPWGIPVIARRAAALLLALAAGLAACAVILLAATRPVSASSHVHAYPGAAPCNTTLQACTAGVDDFDTIVIQPNTYITSFTLQRPISLTGVSSATVILQALPGQRVLTVTGAAISGSVVISGLTFTGGDIATTTTCPESCGGGILITDTAQPLLSHVTISGNAAYQGGGLYATGALRLDASIVAHNTSGHRGGGAYASDGATLNGGLFERNRCLNVFCYGGGLYVNSVLVLTSTRFVSNISTSAGGGVFADWAVILNGGLFEGNQCTGSPSCNGGGLSLSGPLELTGTQFISNTAVSGGGGAHVTGVIALNGGLFERNQCTASGCGGGGLTSGAAPLTMTGTRFMSNTAGIAGGGAAADGAVTLHGGLFEGNQCTAGNCFGGGLYGRDMLTVTASRFVHNSAGGTGGGLYHGSFDPNHIGRVTNSLFAGNTAGQGAAIYLHSPGSATLLHNTIAMPSGQLVTAAVVISNGGAVGITNTLFANYNIGILVEAGTARQDFNLFANVATSATANAFYGEVFGGQDSLTGTAAFVDPAAGDYRIASNSDAVDAGTNAGVQYDFFGTARPIGASYDIGFHEYLAASLTISKAANTALAQVGEIVTYTIVVSNAGPHTAAGVLISDTIPAGLIGATWTCLGSGGSTCPAGGSGTVNVSAPVTLTVGGTATFVLQATVAASAAGSVITNTAALILPLGLIDANTADNSASAAVTVEAPAADYRLYLPLIAR